MLTLCQALRQRVNGVLYILYKPTLVSSGHNWYLWGTFHWRQSSSCIQRCSFVDNSNNNRFTAFWIMSGLSKVLCESCKSSENFLGWGCRWGYFHTSCCAVNCLTVIGIHHLFYRQLLRALPHTPPWLCPLHPGGGLTSPEPLTWTPWTFKPTYSALLLYLLAEGRRVPAKLPGEMFSCCALSEIRSWLCHCLWVPFLVMLSNT